MRHALGLLLKQWSVDSEVIKGRARGRRIDDIGFPDLIGDCVGAVEVGNQRALDDMVNAGPRRPQAIDLSAIGLGEDGVWSSTGGDSW